MSASQGELIDTFERIAHFLRRFEIYIDVRPTTQITDIIVNIMAEMTHILALVTKGIKRGRLSGLISDDRPSFSTYCYTGRFLKKVAGRSDIEDSLQTLDQLTQEVCRMAAAEVLKVAHGAFHDDERAMGDDNTVEAVDVRLEVTDHIMDGYVDWDGAHLVTRISRAFPPNLFYG